MLDAKGKPGITERVFILPPEGQLGPITLAQRTALIQNSLIAGHYEKQIDRESAYEILKSRAVKSAEAAAVANEPAAAPDAKAAPAQSGGSLGGIFGDILGGRGGRREGAAEALAKSAARAIGSQGRSLIRGVLGSLFGGKR